MNRNLLGLILVATLFLSSAAVARTWTDIQGNRLNAKFVRVYEGNVIFSRSGRVVKVPFSQLTPRDQDYIRQELEAKGKGDQLSAASRTRTAGNDSLPGLSPIGEPGAEGDAVSLDQPGEPMPGAGAIRTWTDARGRTMQAQFVGVEGDKVVLLKDGKRVTYPLAGFSLTDQTFIRMQRQSGGQGQGWMPGPAGFPPHSAPGGFPGRHGQGYGGYEEPSADEGMEMSDPAYAGEGMEESDPAYAGEGMDEGEYGGFSQPPGQYGEPGGPAAGSTPYGSAAPYGSPGRGGAGSFPPGMPAEPYPANASSGGSSGSPFPGGGMPMPHQVQIKYCTECKGEVSLDTKIGDTCPHCGIRFVAEETADGRMVDKHGREVSGYRSAVVTFAGIGAVIGAVIGLLVKLLRSGE